ncbi:MAG: hypothetical protein EA356_01620 [Geminicoccaceae bacterium]|nr:MAG: hypothetical protein EA356_01620 [Geminicoccaceae bacterium]
MSLEPYWIEHDSDQALAWGVAQRLAQALRWGAQGETQARLVLSADRLPLDAYRNLADAVLDWRRVLVIPSDEPWIAPTDPASHEHAIRQALLRGPAAKAELLPLLRGGEHPGEDAGAAAYDFGRVPRPFDAVVLGVGDDGRIAGLWPGTDGLDQLLAATTPATVAAIDRPDGSGAHLTLTLRALADAGLILVLGRGARERGALMQALEGASSPVRALFDAARVPVEIHVSP